MEKFEGNVKFLNEYSFETRYGWSYQTVYIYKFEDEKGRILVWKTSSLLCIDREENGYLRPEFPTKESIIKIKASIKGENDYRGEHQIILTRVKLIEIVHRQPTKEELDEERAREQLDSLNDGDFVWEMPYRQFKSHYADCETVAGSYRDTDDRGNYIHPTISVIIRDGRLKNSGVRGEHYSGFRFVNENNEHATYRAVSIENAEKRLNKDFPGHEWKLDHVYEYRTDRIW